MRSKSGTKGRYHEATPRYCLSSRTVEGGFSWTTGTERCGWMRSVAHHECPTPGMRGSGRDLRGSQKGGDGEVRVSHRRRATGDVTSAPRHFQNTGEIPAEIHP